MKVRDELKRFGVLFVAFLVLSVMITGVVWFSMATSEAPTNNYLAENADIIVACRVTDVSVSVFKTRYMFETIEAIKGTIDKEFTITTNEGTNRVPSPSPVHFKKGGVVLLFLSDNDGRYSVFWGAWGKNYLSVVDESLLDSLRAEYEREINTPDELLVISFAILLSITILIAYWVRHKTSL